MSKESAVVKYEAKDGQQITLTFDMVRKYLVHGKAELVKDQEIMFFLGICKSRGLNPFKKDCYLMKYGAEPAAIITSIDYFRSRARAQADCKGYKNGVIVQNKDGVIRDSAGLVLENEKLVGAFFEAKPAGWEVPFRLEVNLSGYIKKTSEGKITKFWQPENQPTMIAKVAESQGLRRLWPDEFQGIYEESEIKPDPNDIVLTGNTGDIVDSEWNTFDVSIPKDVDEVSLNRFLTLCAEQFESTVEEVKANATEDAENFWNQYRKWEGAQKQKEQITKPEAGPQPVQEQSEPKGNEPIEFISSCEKLKAKGQRPKKYCDERCSEKCDQYRGQYGQATKAEKIICPEGGLAPGLERDPKWCAEHCDRHGDCDSWQVWNR